MCAIRVQKFVCAPSNCCGSFVHHRSSTLRLCACQFSTPIRCAPWTSKGAQMSKCRTEGAQNSNCLETTDMAVPLSTYTEVYLSSAKPTHVPEKPCNVHYMAKGCVFAPKAKSASLMVISTNAIFLQKQLNDSKKHEIFSNFPKFTTKTKINSKSAK